MFLKEYLGNSSLPGCDCLHFVL